MHGQHFEFLQKIQRITGCQEGRVAHGKMEDAPPHRRPPELYFDTACLIVRVAMTRQVAGQTKVLGRCSNDGNDICPVATYAEGDNDMVERRSPTGQPAEMLVQFSVPTLDIMWHDESGKVKDVDGSVRLCQDHALGFFARLCLSSPELAGSFGWFGFSQKTCGSSNFPAKIQTMELSREALSRVLPEGVPVPARWLRHVGLTSSAVSRATSSGSLQATGGQAYLRPGPALTWATVLYGAQQTGTPLHLGHTSALALHGLAHYLALGSQPQQVYLLGKRPPIWLMELGELCSWRWHHERVIQEQVEGHPSSNLRMPNVDVPAARLLGVEPVKHEDAAHLLAGTGGH